MSVYDINGNRLTVNRNSKQAVDIFLQNHLISHRGLNSAPENTIPAIEAAIEAGFKHIEVDLGWTSDGVCVLLHDTTIDRTSDGTGNIGSMTFEEVFQYDFGSWKSADYTGTKIPTLKEVLLLAKYKNVAIQLDIAYKNPTDANLQSMVNDIISSGMVDSVDVCCYPDRVAKILSMCPDINMTVGLSNYTIEQVVEMLKDCNYVCLSRKNADYEDALAEAAHKQGWKMQIWTINNAITAREKFLAGADWILTDSLLPSSLS